MIAMLNWSWRAENMRDVAKKKFVWLKCFLETFSKKPITTKKKFFISTAKVDKRK